MDGVVVSRQVHGSTLRVHEGGWAGLLLAPPADGHLTRAPGLLLAVTLADCVPLFLVAPEHRVIGLVHAGWRGTADGIVEHVIATFEARFGIEPRDLRIHLGPAIGGASYEVGPEVFDALGEPVPPGPAKLDLRGVILERAVEAGVDPHEISRSTVDTLRDPDFFSHRGGDVGRHIAFLGIRSPADPDS
jgi:polyphenol oxidase